MPIPQTLEDFDVPEAVARMLDQPALWWQALALFVEHFADWESDWRASASDAEGERRLVHALRSAAANVGATRLSASAAALEKLLQKRLAGETTEPADVLRGQLQQDFFLSWRTAADALRAGEKEWGG